MYLDVDVSVQTRGLMGVVVYAVIFQGVAYLSVRYRDSPCSETVLLWIGLDWIEHPTPPSPSSKAPRI
jgi:hypothetical protein